MKSIILIILVSMSSAQSFEPTNFDGSKQELRSFFDGLWGKFKSFDNYKNEPVILDKGLFEGATYLSDWLQSFGEGHSCKEITSMDEYRKLKSSEYCMYFIVPMYYYSPKDLETLNIDKFKTADLNDMLFSLPKRQRNRYLNKYQL